MSLYIASYRIRTGNGNKRFHGDILEVDIFIKNSLATDIWMMIAILLGLKPFHLVYLTSCLLLICTQKYSSMNAPHPAALWPSLTINEIFIQHKGNWITFPKWIWYLKVSSYSVYFLLEHNTSCSVFPEYRQRGNDTIDMSCLGKKTYIRIIGWIWLPNVVVHQLIEPVQQHRKSFTIRTEAVQHEWGSVRNKGPAHYWNASNKVTTLNTFCFLF